MELVSAPLALVVPGVSCWSHCLLELLVVGYRGALAHVGGRDDRRLFLETSWVECRIYAKWIVVPDGRRILNYRFSGQSIVNGFLAALCVERRVVEAFHFDCHKNHLSVVDHLALKALVASVLDLTTRVGRLRCGCDLACHRASNKALDRDPSSALDCSAFDKSCQARPN